MSTDSRVLLTGLKGSGKTTFLAALWHQMESQEIPTQLCVSELQPNREYLNRLRSCWLRLEEVGRTSLQIEEDLSLHLEDVKGGDRFHVTVPDLSGESIKIQWTARRATKRYADYAREATGVLLFVHPGEIIEARRIEPNDDAGVSNEQCTLRKEWSPESAPTQVQLVDALQFIQWLRPKKLLAIAVVISAWDLVKSGESPATWVGRRLPLLAQFLRTNFDRDQTAFYGVSAIGGDLETDRERLGRETVPSRRIKVVEGTLPEHADISAPLRFALGLPIGLSPSEAVG